MVAWTGAISARSGTKDERFGTHNRKGRVTVGEMVASYIEHIDDHMDYIRKKRVTLGKPLPEDRT